MRLSLIALLAFSGPALAQPSPPNQVESVNTGEVPISIVEIATGLDTPWGMTFLPDGQMLVTELPGDLVVVSPDGTVSDPIEGTPPVFAQGQGGLMDVALHPDFAENRQVYLSFAEPGEGATAGTALGRGRLSDDLSRIEDWEVIFRQEPKVEGPNHFGNRIVFDGDGHVFLALGERFQFGPAQELSNTLGAVVRLNLDGTIPEDNPFVGEEGAEDAIWSYGHRNIEAAIWHPEMEQVWVTEMGPLGGDELNALEPGANYGWPVVSWGINYDGVEIPNPSEFPEFADAVYNWSPVRSPSGMILYTGELFPEWQGDVLFGSLSAGGVEHVDMEGGEVAGSEFIPMNTRIRDVVQGPDGGVYLLTNVSGDAAGAVWRMEPLEVHPPSADGGRSGPGAEEDGASD
ncbi:Glucose/arabinose dehydrogenase, beta-propeller fold [Palleronia marisminoris]|uniref:Soluble aldose sugar dehydrogenase YliI n=1 Tax=Palleronia marisminoris TaxID=315423 RepID=A0A1Y5TTU2_9RHOB|nr:PQQ-dependent sugar dehydrogenase [Palleronia marisminoris]SFH48805.1 Glucose/arabinose dehydrogenase, beta-propeller fold [Palleronia marisminoris]SLN69534.1 Soluble aldose sugar dehydrogenase YliI precursor [Palleronia marisminoris]